MRRLYFAFAGLSFVLAGLVGCGGGGGGKEETASTSQADKATAPTKRDRKKGKKDGKGLASGSGSLRGKVTFQGPKPDLAAMDASLKAQMDKKADDVQHCEAEASPSERQQQEWRISDDGGLANVFVYLKPAEGTYFELTADTPGVKAAKGKEVDITQPHCAFIPHALTFFPSYRDAKTKKVVETGETFYVTNTAKMAHNTKYGDNNRDQEGGNIMIQPGGKVQVTNLKPSDNEVTIQCNIHPWMSAYLRVFDHPYFAVTDKDGNFEIKNVPAGDVNVVAWHEGAKFLTSNGSKGETITLTDKETTKDFTAKAPAK